jgi:hypothetical protein
MEDSRGLREKVRKIKMMVHWPELLMALVLSVLLFFMLILFTY